MTASTFAGAGTDATTCTQAALAPTDELPGDILAGAPTTPGERRAITSDPVRASAEIRDAYAPHRLELRGRAADFELDLRRFELVGLELSMMSVGGDITLTAPPPRDRYIIAIPVSGHVTAGTRNESCTVSRLKGIVMNPDQPVYFSDWSPDYRHLCIRIGKGTIDSALGLMLQHPAPRSTQFRFALDLTSQRSGPLLRALQLAALEILEKDVSVARSMMASSISQLLVNALLLAQDHSFTESVSRPQVDPSHPAALRVAQRFIAENAGESISVRDIANAANLSVRVLEDVFSRCLGMPPMTYLRAMRLDLVREDLRRLSPEETSVGAVAQRWGFNHAGRFSGAYKARFGVFPSRELRARTLRGQQ